jgi:hypothetical protein
MSGQSLAEMLTWEPRDVDTLEQIYHDRTEAADQQALDERFANGTAQVFANMRGGR